MPITKIAKWLQSGVHLIQEDLGYSPVTLHHAIESYSNFLPVIEPTPQSIHAGSMVRWHEWGDRRFRPTMFAKHNIMYGWRFSQGHYSSFELAMPEFDDFGQCEIVPAWQCEIQDVVGFSSSKSDLQQFTDLDQFAQARTPNWIEEITEENLLRNLAHSEIRIGNELHADTTTDHFCRYRWDGRTFLMNDGGSHHFAAARYIADKLNRKVYLNGKLKIYSINPSSVEALRERFDILVIDDSAEEQNQFHQAMKAFSATYLWRKLPPPHENSRAIFLPKNETRSRTVAANLKTAGTYDLAALLQAIVEQQT
ncbi:DUF6685 family protein [Methylomonas rosea]|uniref:Uncharacterized protein n=1 Tax=Methylomonas rosea TaxID=2952227 RepID=A0ABT1TUQ6_9GAMM|nr:DUF6685 family protein [Methylomonas sp. WSC-7]MCQ8118499.1 hypothetical protein [Methylomonas sp. WSC-7]